MSPLLSSRILIVDDEEQFRANLARELAASGYDVFQASSGEEALAMFEQDFYEIVLLDMIMPGMHGEEVLAKLMELPAQPEVIVLTGHVDMEMAVGLISAGAFDYLLKPYNREELLDKIVLARDNYTFRQSGEIR